MSEFQAYFKEVGSRVDVPAIWDQWQALSLQYDVDTWILPLPFWAKRGYDHPPEKAWQILRQDLQASAAANPICIYFHVPFCSSKCGFCDSYSFKLGTRHGQHIAGYVTKLQDEIQLWAQQGSLRQRPVSTVHFGGGTPNLMGAQALSEIVQSCRAHFGVTSQTEWALEATVESLTQDMFSVMHELGFRRLHVGVQSLQPVVRQAIGRRCPPGEVLEKVRAALERDWIVSVDLICGLPHQSLRGWVADIERLVAAGVNGFSLYELLIYPQNRRWAEKYGLLGRNHLPNYWAFLAGAQVLGAAGYAKNLFNHWADRRDHNIYFTFPRRGEDCLAMGTIADGVFGDYHYRHPRYAQYLRAAGPVSPGLEGGLRRNAFESAIQPLLVSLLSGHILPGEVAHFQIPAQPGRETLLEHWQSNALVAPDAAGGYHLTANGSWFAGNMVAELGDCFGGGEDICRR